jgi:hypothetical protein
MITLPVQKFYLFGFDYSNRGYLFDVDTGQLTANATAYQQIYLWTVGAFSSAPCSANGTVWTCSFTRSAGYQAQAVWDSSQNCLNGCTFSSYTAPSQFTQYQDLSGNVTTITTSATVQIGSNPILLENGNIP